MPPGASEDCDVDDREGEGGPAPVRVEAATAEDVDALADLWVALVAGQRDHGAHLLAEKNRQTAREFLGQHVAGERVLVARDGAIVGFATFHVEHGAYEQDTTRGIVDNVYVVPERRGDGIGSALLDAAEAELAERGAETLSLSVMADNDAARRLYERRGYRPHRVTLERPAESDTHTRDGG